VKSGLINYIEDGIINFKHERLEIISENINNLNIVYSFLFRWYGHHSVQCHSKKKCKATLKLSVLFFINMDKLYYYEKL